MKTCVDCGRRRPITDYHKNPGYKDGLQRRCKTCAKAMSAASYRRRRDEIRERSRINHLARYGFTDETFDATIAAQGGVCALCRVKTPNGKGRWHVDHDHSCCPGGRACPKCFRGLLCMSCNQFIGKYEKWRDRVEEYLAVFRKGRS